MKKSNGSIEGRLIRSMEQAVAISKGKTKAKQSYALPLTARQVTAVPAPELNKAAIVKIRSRLNASQKVFADVLNVSIGTVRSWEQGLRVPDGPSKRLLEVAYLHPQIILQTAQIGEPPRAKPHYLKARGPKVERRREGDRRASTVSKRAIAARS